MKVIAYYALHYGSEWLEWSMRSIRPFVDEIIVIYSAKPSFGHGTNIPCPDTEQQLREIAGKFYTLWYPMGASAWEGSHRDRAVQLCEDRGADIILVVDHDEIWEPDMLQTCLEYVSGSTAKHYGVHMQHYYRSVSWVCHDEAMPIRFHNIKQGQAEVGTSWLPREYGNVHHYGYAQSSPLMNYKWLIHGHKGELRPNWHQQKFRNWKPGVKDVHPTNEQNYWDPIPYDKHQLEELIGDHPYFLLDIIP